MKYIWCCDICACQSCSARRGLGMQLKLCLLSASWAVVVHAAVTVVLTSGTSVFQFMHHWSSAK